MPSIDLELKNFLNHLKENSPLRAVEDGNYYIQNYLISCFWKFTGREEIRWLEVSRAFRLRLDALEKIPVRFSGSAQLVDFKLYVEVSYAVLERLFPFSSQEAEREKIALTRALYALLYRLEAVNGGLDPAEPNKLLVEKLSTAAQLWKSNQSIYRNKELTISDRSIIEESSRYPELMDLILSHEELARDYFAWALRDKISIEPFVAFPHFQKKIIKAELNGRIGRLGGTFLKVQKIENQEGLEKVLTLPFEGHEISLLDEERVVMFRGNYALSISEIFQVFENKKYEPGNLEFMRDGIINWNTHLWGWWDAAEQEHHIVDLQQTEWWKQLPHLDILTLKEARQKFGHHLTGREWNLAMISTRLSPNLDYENAHAYTSIAIPQDDGKYVVYVFGKYATTFPETMLEALMTMGRTSHATVAYPDDNVYYTHRQKTRHSHALNEQQGLAYMRSVKSDMNLSREGHFVYQIESENCAKWSYQKLETIFGYQRLPEIFRMRLLDAEPSGVMEKIFGWIKQLPYWMQTPVTVMCHLPLGARQGRWIIEKGDAVWKSLTHHSFWDDVVIYHPSMLHKKQELGHIGRFVAMGVTFLGKVITERIFSLSRLKRAQQRASILLLGEIFFRKEAPVVNIAEGKSTQSLDPSQSRSGKTDGMKVALARGFKTWIGKQFLAGA